MTASARGLFRATGKHSKPVPARLLDGSLEIVEHLERETDDFYPTPAQATRAFLFAEQERLRDFQTIWEPAVGDGAMSREMKALGFDVFGSDMVDRGCGATIRSFYDFNACDAPSRAIATNPPYQECGFRHANARWLKHGLDVLGIEYMALLLNWTWPGAGGLAGFWADHPAARVYLMRWKIDFTGQGAPPMLNAWFVWDRAWQGETVLRMLDRKDARQGELFAMEAARPP